MKAHVHIGAVLMVLVPLTSWAQHLAGRHYTTSDGLVHDSVVRLTLDSQGFLWAATTIGLSRFDGHRFASYSTFDGLPDPIVNQVFEDRRGRVWVATNGGGVARFRETPGAGGRPFDVLAVGPTRASNRVNDLVETGGGLWAATDGGLYALRDGPAPRFEPVPLRAAGLSDAPLPILRLAAGSQGDLWLATARGLLRRAADGRVVRYERRGFRGRGSPRSIGLTPDGLVWVTHADGLVVWRPAVNGGAPPTVSVDDVPCAPGVRPSASLVRPGTACVLATAFGLPSDDLAALLVSSQGTVIVGTTTGTLVAVDGGRIVPLWRAGTSIAIRSAIEDHQGNLWISTSLGIYRLARGGLVTWRNAMSESAIVNALAFAEGAGDEMYALTSGGWILRIGPQGPEAVRPKASEAAMTATLVRQTPLRDSRGEWWIGTAAGLYRFPRVGFDALREARPAAVYRMADGLPSDLVGALYEDRRGDIWIATFGAHGEVLARWERSRDRIHTFRPADGLPPFNVPVAFAEDRAGTLWIALREGGLAAQAGAGFERVADLDEHTSPVGALYFDSRGRLWLGTRSDGVLRVDDPSARPWRPTRYGRLFGLDHELVSCIFEDRGGGI